MFSIIVPTLNAAETLAACLDSVVRQTYSDFELVLIDGCSTDETLDIANSFVPNLGTRLVIHSGADQNVYDAINCGIRRATGTWLLFLWADDTLCEVDTFARVAAFIGEHKPSDLVYGDVILRSNSSRYAGVFDLDRLLFEQNICHQSIFYRRELFAGTDPDNLRYPILGDWDFNIRCFSDPALVSRYMDIAVVRWNNTAGIGSRFLDWTFTTRLPHYLVERNPVDAPSVSFLAESHFEQGDYANARKWYAHRVEMGGCEEEVYCAMYRVAESLSNLGAPWPEVQDSYLKAWEFRPARAEPLYSIALRHRVNQRYRLGHLFAKSAAAIPFSEEETLLTRRDVYAWRAIDEQAVCASWIGKHAEAFTLWRRLLARPDIPDDDRQRIASNRDVCVPTMIEAAAPYPDALVQSLAAGSGDAETVVSLIAGPDRAGTELTLNSFVRCCTDVSRVGRFLAVDVGLSVQDRAELLKRYGFLEFADPGPAGEPGNRLARLRAAIHQRYWLHLGQGWQFFAPENLITRLTAVLEAEPQALQVGINFADAVKLTGTCAHERAVRRAPASDTGRYVLADAVANGPAMFDTTRLDRAGGLHATDADPIAALGRRATAAGLRTASLDEVLCIAAVD